jgi:hypothetical protein
MTVTLASMKAFRGGMFDTKDDAEVEEVIQAAQADCPIERWGDRTDRGVTLLAAHMLVMDWYENATIVSGAIALTGGRSSSGSGSGDMDLKETTYGRQWIRLRRLVIGTPAYLYGTD